MLSGYGEPVRHLLVEDKVTARNFAFRTLVGQHFAKKQWWLAIT